MTKGIIMNPGCAVNGDPGQGILTSARGAVACSDGLADDLVNRRLATYSNNPLSTRVGVSPSRNRAITVGDSRMGFCFGDSYAVNGQRSIYARGIWPHLQGISGNYFRLVQAAGVTGDKIADVCARWNNNDPGEMFGGVTEATGSQFGVAPYNADWLFMMLGINDITYGQTLAQMQADAERLITLIEASDTRAVWLTEGAVASGTVGYGQAFLNQLLTWNQWLRNRAALSKNLLVVDAWPLSCNPSTGQANAGWIVDNTVHPGITAVRTLAAAIWSALQAKWGLQAVNWLPVSNGEVWVSGQATTIPNRYPDPLSLNTWVAATGPVGVQAGSVLPPGMAFSDCSNATVTSSQVVDEDGFGNAVQMDITFTGAGYVLLNSRNTGGSFSGGETTRAGVSIKAYGLTAGAQAPLATSHALLSVKPQLKVQNADASIFFSTFNDTTGAVDGPQAGDLSEHMITWPITLGAGSPSRVQTLLYVTSTGAGTVRVKASRFAHFANGGPVG
jgi:hypothetical protein